MKNIYIIVFLIILTKCFDIYFFDHYLLTLIDVTILFVFALLEFGKGGFYAKSILLLTSLVMISVVNSHISHKQSIYMVLLKSYFMLGLLSFFIPLYYKLSSEILTKVIVVFSIIFCICYIIQWQLFPMVIFKGAMDEISINEAQFRMRMPCSICSYLLFFFGLSRFLKKYNAIYLLYSILGFIPMIIMGFRSLLLLSAICVVYLFIYYTSKKTKGLFYYLVSFAIIGIVLSQIPIVQEKIDEIGQRQERGGFFENDDYKRIVSFYYYSNEVFNSRTDRFLGGGVPIVDMNNLHSQNLYAGKVCRGYTYGLYWNDLGLIGLGYIIGFPSVLVIAFIILRVIYRCRNDKLLFVSCTLLTVLLGSIFTTQELYRSGNLIIIGMLLYLEYIYSKEKILATN